MFLLRRFFLESVCCVYRNIWNLFKAFFFWSYFRFNSLVIQRQRRAHILAQLGLEKGGGSAAATMQGSGQNQSPFHRIRYLLPLHRDTRSLPLLSCFLCRGILVWESSKPHWQNLQHPAERNCLLRCNHCVSKTNWELLQWTRRKLKNELLRTLRAVFGAL